MSEEEQAYASVIDTWTVVKKILSLELTRERFEQFDTSQIDTLFSHIDAYRRDPQFEVASIEGFDFFSHLPHLIGQASKFYNNSVARDKAMYANTMKALEDSGARMAIIVAGGFHASGLSAIIERENINFAIVNPSFIDADNTNFYKTIMMNEPMPLDRLFPLPELEVANRLSPRVRLTNMLANPVLTQQLMKETVLMAKILTIAKSSELFDQLRDLRQDMPMSFRNQASETVRAFGQRWLNLYKKVKQQRGESLSYKELEEVSHLLKKMVVLQVAELKEDQTSLGIQIMEQTGARTKILVSFSEYKRMAEKLIAQQENGPKISLDPTEKIGSFEFTFHKMADADLYGAVEQPATTLETTNGVFWRKQNDVRGLVSSIAELKKASAASPFDNKLKIQVIKKLQRLSKFLRFAAQQEQIKNNTAQSLLLRANAALYVGNIDRANHFFGLYLQELPSEERNLADEYFRRNTILRGQKISLPITDESERAYVDEYGREISSALFDDTLVYGSEPSKVLQNRLIELANRLDSENKKYLATVVRSAAFRLTDNSRNYHYDDIDVARMLASGKDAYKSSLLGKSDSSSFGAISDHMQREYDIQRATPGVTYLYDRDVTMGLQERHELRFTSPEAGLISTVMPPESITAILVNGHHIDYALAVLREHPDRTTPLLDTFGNLLWRNAPVEEMIEKYEKAYMEFEQREKTKPQATYMKRIKNPKKIVAMSDLHADVYAFRQTLKEAGVIDEQDNFVAPAGTAVVIAGDSIGRGTGAQQKEMLDLLLKLQNDAESKKSQFIVMLGNHETELLSGQWHTESEEKMRDLISSLGFQERQATELRDALANNDLFKLGVLRKENPAGMKYIDYLWHLPVIAHVGGHVFLHSGPTKSFNITLDNLLQTHPDWSVEQCVDHIFSKEISQYGFNSKFFDRRADSIMATPMMSLPEFLNDQKIVNKFLAFFDGAALLAVGHNKALGVIGQSDEYNKIKRVGIANNIVKLDVGTDMQANKSERRNQGRAYIVDPQQVDFVTTLSESGDRESLMLKDDKRVQFIRTEAALLYDTMLADKSKKFLEDAAKPVEDDVRKMSTEMRMFFRTFFMVYVETPEILNKAFKEQTRNILSPKPHFLKAKLDSMDVIPEIAELLRFYREYIKQLKLGTLSQDEISLDQFEEFIESQRNPSNPFEAVSTKVIGTRIIDMENDVKRFYSVMAQSDIESMNKKMIFTLKTRLEEKIKQYEAKLSGLERSDDKKLRSLKRALFLFAGSERELAFKLLDVHNGEPCIFLEEGGAITGFILKRTIYLSAPIVNLLWDRFKANDDKDALDQLLALAVHELHEFREDDAIDLEKNLLHRQAEDLERVICGTGVTGSNLDDTIEEMIKEYKDQTQDVELIAIKKFLKGLRGYLKSQGDLELYQAIFARTRLPIEADVLENLTLADNMFGLVIDTRPLEVFHALLENIADRTSLIYAVDHAMFTEAELLKLVDLVTTPVPAQVVRSSTAIADLTLGAMDQTKPAAPVDLQKNLNATRAVDKSL